MLKCWNEKPEVRPTFAQLKKMFKEENEKCKSCTEQNIEIENEECETIF